MKFNPNSLFYTFDDPISYKTLKFYPVRMRDFFLFHQLSICLLLDRTGVKDPQKAIKAIQMSYLEFLFSETNQEINYIYILDALLRLALNKKDEEFVIDYRMNELGKPVFKIGDDVFDSEDFDKIKTIIAEQNMLDLIDETIQKDVRDKMEEARRYKEKLNKSKTASLEEQMLALSMYSGWSLEDIYNLTIRKFFLSIKRANHMIMSNIYLTASMSGFVTFKDKSVLRGWLVDLDLDDRNSDVTVNLEAVQNKINFNDAKQK